jgi:hypothetical protein
LLAFLLRLFDFDIKKDGMGLGSSLRPSPPVTVPCFLPFCFFHGSEKTIPNYAIHFFCASLLSRKQFLLNGGGGAKGEKLEKQRRPKEKLALGFEYSE